MRNLLASLAAAALALGASGCGDTCSTTATEVQPTSSANCAGRTAATAVAITISARPTCQSCAQTSPTCDISEVGTITGGKEVFLDVKVQECDANKSCGSASCSFQPVTCSYTPNFSGVLRINYRTGGTTASEDLTVGAGGGTTSCTL